MKPVYLNGQYTVKELLQIVLCELIKHEHRHNCKSNRTLKKYVQGLV